MSHPEQLGFFAAVAAANRRALDGGAILEVGSYDVNGTVRSEFSSAATYVGVDLVEGPGVDLVGFGHEIDHPDGSYDAVLSGECFEHDPHWRATFANMVRLTRPGGLTAFTCASSGRLEHGTRRTVPTDSPGTQAIGIDYYRNLTREDFVYTTPIDEWFSDYRFWYMPTSCDLYFAGVRSGEASATCRYASLPSDLAVDQLRNLMPLVNKLARLPLRIADRMVSESRYQAIALPYSMLLHKVHTSLAQGPFNRRRSV